jgi:double-stranded uracil-DNA glycosylase
LSAGDAVPDVLPDLLQPGLRVVFCGTAAGAVSAVQRAYYAGPGNRFWRILADTGLTPRRLQPKEFRLLPSFGIGLTDLAKGVSGADAELPGHGFDRQRLAASIRRVRPGCLAFNGKKAASLFFGVPGMKLAYGMAPALPDFPPVMVLPSTSGAANGSWDAAPWFALAGRLGNAG